VQELPREEIIFVSTAIRQVYSGVGAPVGFFQNKTGGGNMSKLRFVGIKVLIAFAIGIALAEDTLAQQKTLKEQLVGTWLIVSSSNIAPDGTRKNLFGPNPKGILMIDVNGRYVQMQVNPDRPKFKGKTRFDGTPAENKAIMQATAVHFGTWTVNEADKSVVQHVEAHIFPNDDGRDTKLSITLTGDELKYTNPTPSSGGIAEVVFKRAK
jgi:hypothetical protein